MSILLLQVQPLYHFYKSVYISISLPTSVDKTCFKLVRSCFKLTVRSKTLVYTYAFNNIPYSSAKSYMQYHR